MNRLLQRMNMAFRILVVLLAGFVVSACEKPVVKMTNQEIYLYQGADRGQKLLDKAKKEGQVNVYSSMQPRDAKALTEAFEKQYGIKVELWRAQPDKIVQRILIEAKAERHDVDILEINGPEIERISRENLLSEFYSPVFSELPSLAFPKHRQYVVDRLNFFVMAYNTKQVRPELVPDSYHDLLHPRWKGKLAIEPNDMNWFASVVKSMGEEAGLAYFRKLATLKPAMHQGHTLVAERVASGEVPIFLTAYNHSVQKLKEKGASIDWKPLQPAFAQPNAIGVTKDAPHPHAALLFADFVLSKTGQEIIKEVGRVPVNLAVDSPLNKFEYQLIDPAIVLDESEKWAKHWANLFFDGKILARHEAQ